MPGKSNPIAMVIDDDEFIQKLLDDTLASEGYKVILSDSAERTLKLLEKSVPDIFIVDIILPGQSGVELCKKIRQLENTASIPILILSSKHAVSDRVNGLNAGADDYLVKPFHLEELVARVKALLRRTDRKMKPGSQSQSSTTIPEIKPEKTEPLPIKPVSKTIKAEVTEDVNSFASRKKKALEFFSAKLIEEALQIWEELKLENPKDIEIKKYIEISRTQLMKKYLDVLKSKNAVPFRTSQRPEDFIGLDFNTEEGFIFSRIDGVTDFKGIVAISGMKPIKAYNILYRFFQSGVIKIKDISN